MRDISTYLVSFDGTLTQAPFIYQAFEGIKINLSRACTGCGLTGSRSFLFDEFITWYTNPEMSHNEAFSDLPPAVNTFFFGDSPKCVKCRNIKEAV